MQRSLIYKVLVDRAKEQLPYLRYIDLNKGQMQRMADNYPIPLPALLIELQAAEASNTSMLHQLLEINIRLLLYIDLVTDSFDGAEQYGETMALLDRSDALHDAFHGYTTETIRLTRTRELAPEYGLRYMMLASEYKAIVKVPASSYTVTVPTPTINITTS